MTPEAAISAMLVLIRRSSNLRRTTVLLTLVMKNLLSMSSGCLVSWCVIMVSGLGRLCRFVRLLRIRCTKWRKRMWWSVFWGSVLRSRLMRKAPLWLMLLRRQSLVIGIGVCYWDVSCLN